MTLSVPGWINSIIVNGNEGSVQTSDLSVETGKDVWIVVTDAENATVSYEEPTETAETAPAAEEPIEPEATAEPAPVQEEQSGIPVAAIVVVVIVVVVAAGAVIYMKKKKK